MNRLKEKCKEWVNQYRFRIIAGLGLLCIIMLIGMLVVMGKGKDTENQNGFANSNGQATRQQSSFSSHHSTNQQTFVDVEGAVKHPGVYQFTENMRVDDAINLAGGLTRSADRKHIDLAKKLTDQETIYIPVKGEIKTTPGSPGSGGHGNSSGSGQSNDGKININQADQHQLQSIDGIGQKRADKIVEYRKQHGNFSSVEDLKKINGIGDKFLSNIKSHVTV